MNEKLIILIFGLNRSGTSALAGSLKHCGVTLDFDEDSLRATLSKADQFRPDGKYESFEVPAVLDFVRRVTQHSGAHQNHPMIGDEIRYSVTDVLSLLGLVNLIPTFPFAIKDPLLTFHFQHWKRIIRNHFEGVSLSAIVSMREPLEQAKALLKRGFCSTLRSGLDQWLRYYSEVAFLIRSDEPVHLVVYDHDRDAFVCQIEGLCKDFDLPLDEASVRSFFQPVPSNPGRRLSVEDHPLGDSINALYDGLASKSRHPKHAIA